MVLVVEVVVEGGGGNLKEGKKEKDALPGLEALATPSSSCADGTEENEKDEEGGLHEGSYSSNKRKRIQLPTRAKSARESKVKQVTVFHEVRAVLGEDESGKAEVWFYIPHTGKVKGAAKRMGQYLIPMQGKPGFYCEPGALEEIDTEDDIGIYKKIPFIKTCRVGRYGKEIKGSYSVAMARAFTSEELEPALKKLEEALKR